MKRGHFIGMDTHYQFCELAVVNHCGAVVRKERCATCIPDILKLVEQVPRPRSLVIEEGPLAGWLWRNLHEAVDQLVVSEPRRNRLIAKDGDKDDDLDAEKLAQLLRGGYVKVVHQVQTLEQALLKQYVSLYYHRVRQRVREALRISSLFRQHGVMIRERAFVAEADRAALLARLPEVRRFQEAVVQCWTAYDALVEQEEQWRKQLLALARQEEVVQRFQAVPGYGWLRAVTFYAYVDTPWRFRSKAALWKYLGIGLQRRHSGNGPERLSVPVCMHRPLKNVVLGAALSAVLSGNNPFAGLYRRYCEQGLSAKLARRSVARAQTATLWGLWKNGSAYRPAWVGVAAAAARAVSVSG